MAQAVQYSLTVKNDSEFAGDVCVYQRDPDINDPNVMSLAWFCKYLYPTTTTKFVWTIDYSFVWDYTGTLVPGVVFDSSQDWDADLSLSNQVTLTFDGANQAFTFKNQTQNPTGGSLFVLQDATIPSKVASAGIAMSGAGTYVMQARPNWEFIFTPHPVYWVTFGTFTQGEVLDTTSISNAAEVEFPANVFNMEAELKDDNTWTIATD